ncbi:Uncharacterized protein PBTT_07109 [Plasmodiophora brassicae]|uniref:Uncharacterized protein n=1 Tax=Plasmodiophora brassicae TaxID=37360 RepID=A0A0G4J8M2_PLABS|nr:hypothetical protein PBRA_003296 [Plasmodiophora brassicae]SPQ99653.1 unnamed protein product [Plasmodiophora brassicae]
MFRERETACARGASARGLMLPKFIPFGLSKMTVSHIKGTYTKMMMSLGNTVVLTPAEHLLWEQFLERSKANAEELLHGPNAAQAFWDLLAKVDYADEKAKWLITAAWLKNHEKHPSRPHVRSES